VELLAPLGTARTRRRFGGHGIYRDELFIALFAFGRLWPPVAAFGRLWPKASARQTRQAAAQRSVAGLNRGSACISATSARGQASITHALPAGKAWRCPASSQMSSAMPGSTACRRLRVSQTRPSCTASQRRCAAAGKGMAPATGQLQGSV